MIKKKCVSETINMLLYVLNFYIYSRIYHTNWTTNIVLMPYEVHQPRFELIVVRMWDYDSNGVFKNQNWTILETRVHESFILS